MSTHGFNEDFAALAEPTQAGALTQLQNIIRIRLKDNPPPTDTSIIRFPVGLFFIRGDRAGKGADIVNEARASFNYWHHDSGKHFDILFAGWSKKGEQIIFSIEDFLNFRKKIESLSKWRYTGETDLLLLNFDYLIKDKYGNFAFEEVIFLPVEEMIRDGVISSLDALMNEIINTARSSKLKDGKSAVWEISNKIGYLRGRKELWEALRKMVLRKFAKTYESLRPFAVCDLRT